MTTITIDRATVEQALEALESLFNWKVDPERGKRCGDAVVALRAALAQQAEPVLQGPVAWRYWKQKWNCWEYSDTKLEFPAVPAGTKMEPLYLVSREVKSERPPVGTVHKSVKGGVVWNRWPDEMDDGTHLYVNPPPCQTCEALARTVMMDQVGKA